MVSSIDIRSLIKESFHVRVVVSEATMAVEVSMAVAAISVESASDTATVRVFRFAFCALALVVTPDATVTVQLVPAGRGVVAAISVSVAVTVPELLWEAAKMVEPQPFGDAVREPVNEKSGNLIARTSLTLRTVFSAKRKDNDVAVDAYGDAIVSIVSCVADVTTAVDAVIAVGAMSLDAASETAIVRVTKSAFCELALVVIPEEIVTVHAVPAGISAVPDVSATAAPAAAELL